MKVLDKTPAVEFQPIVLEIVIESEAELSEFYHRMNITQSDVKRVYERSSVTPQLYGEAAEAPCKVWRVLENHVTIRELDHVLWRNEDEDENY